MNRPNALVFAASVRRFGSLTVTGNLRAPTYHGEDLRVECSCDCGAVVMVGLRSLVALRRRGCRRAGCVSAANRKHGHAAASRTPEYRSWRAMLTRCDDPRFIGADRYSGRGITVCDRWRSFECFLADMGVRPKGTSLDRIDNDGDYEPGNCRWATLVEQQRNTRRNSLITFEGKTMALAAWADVVGIQRGTIGLRLRRGWSVAEALTTVPDLGNRWKRNRQNGDGTPA